MPPKVVHRPELEIHKKYPSGHLPMRRGATALITLSISPSGAVEDVRVEGVSSERFRNDLAAYVRSWRFVPARDENGRAVRATLPLTIRF